RGHREDPRVRLSGQARRPRPGPGSHPRLRERTRLSLLRRRRCLHISPGCPMPGAPPGCHRCRWKGAHMLEIKNLTRRFGDLTAVDNVSFEVDPGKFTGFVGGNGAGKTTTMRLVMGLLQPN